MNKKCFSEADILQNWSKSKEWRADARYGCMVIKVIIDHFQKIIVMNNKSIEILSNDNDFLNYNPFFFTQRTLLARWVTSVGETATFLKILNYLLTYK